MAKDGFRILTRGHAGSTFLGTNLRRSAQVRAVKTTRRFESVAQRPIHADVGAPDERDGFGRRESPKVRHDAEPNREDVRVSDIVKSGSDPRADPVPGHEEIGGQQKSCKQQPGVTGGRVESNGHGQDEQSLQTEDEAG